MKIRYLPQKALPAYIFIPGKNPHPKKVDGHMEGEQDPIVPPIDAKRPQLNEALRYALDLFNHGYYWESHVYFEALWNAHGRQGPISVFLKGMIKLGAAGVKLTLNQPAIAREHKDRAIELFEELLGLEGEVFLGFPLEALIDALNTSQSLPDVYPEWD